MDDIKVGANYTPQEIASWADCPVDHVYREIHRENLKAYRFGTRSIRAYENDVSEWLSTGRHVPHKGRPGIPLSRKMKRVLDETDSEFRRGNVYFVRCARHIKIGFAKNVERRIAELQAFIPYQIELLGSVPGTISGEKELHKLLKRRRVHSEWFRLTPRLHEAIMEVCNASGSD